MRIALIHNQFIRSGGMERYLFDLVVGFSGAGHDVTVICYKVDSPQPLSDLSRVIRYDFSLVPKPLRRFAFDKSVRKTLGSESFDLTIALPEIQDADIAICGGTHLAYLDYMQIDPSVLDRAQVKLESKSYQSAKTVVAHSPMLSEELQRLYGIPESQLKVILPPTDTEQFQRQTEQQRTESKKRFDIKDGVTSILLCSTGHHRKGLGPLLGAMKLLPTGEFELLVAGRQVDELNQPDAPTNVRALGYVTDMPALYNAVDITALPALYEPFGLVAVESLQCGTPVLISKTVGAGAVVSDSEGVIINEITPQEIADGILNLRDNPRDVHENFASVKGLTLGSHIQALLGLHQ